ncbi:uncharacterized protein PgNI_02411 [Pyricularia grisea]|uniref:Uncharacterized protein n=1 Tax=Pyricularia grisea TaxID=148305 RepID=A0A6P8BHN8_PYRGI|nr:uncharacterized protein PgNI_02411 [Pyricularia grisea]TLD16157.1 hypothetical protein PgNI_02411 [Pyricularia grisea]
MAAYLGPGQGLQTPSFFAPATTVVVRYKISANSNAFGCNNLCPAVCARAKTKNSRGGIVLRVRAPLASITCSHRLPAVKVAAPRALPSSDWPCFSPSLTLSLIMTLPYLPCPAPLHRYHRIPAFTISPRNTPSAPLLPFLSFCRYPRLGPLIPAT